MRLAGERGVAEGREVELRLLGGGQADVAVALEESESAGERGPVRGGGASGRAADLRETEAKSEEAVREKQPRLSFGQVAERAGDPGEVEAGRGGARGLGRVGGRGVVTLGKLRQRQRGRAEPGVVHDPACVRGLVNGDAALRAADREA